MSVGTCGFPEDRGCYRQSLILIRSDHSQEVAEAHGAALAPKHIAAAEEHESGHRADIETLGHGLVLVDIDLDDAEGVAHLMFQVFQNGVHHLARAAPGGEEIDQRELVAVDDFVEFFHDSI